MFDPYHKWLAIPKDQRPPNHYQMLGLAVGETDPEVIDEAALRQTAHVRTYQLGPHSADCTRLLNEIALARTTLLNPAKKKDYDAQLAKKAERAPARSDQIASKPAAQAIAKEFAFEEPDEPIVHAGSDSRAGKKAAKATKAEPKLHKEGVFLTKGMLIGIVGGAAAFLVLIVVVLVAFVGKGGDPKDKGGLAQSKKDKDKKKRDLPPVDPEDQKPPEVKPPKKDPPKKVDPPIAIADPPELPKDANGLFIQGEIDCGKESLRRDIGKDFDITKSWVLSCGFWLPDLHKDGPRQLLIWSDERGGYDPIHLSQIGDRIYTRITDCRTDAQHAIEVPFGVAAQEWHKATVRYLADERTLELFIDDRLLAKQKSNVLPTVDRPMPIWIGSLLGKDQRFHGKLRDLRLGNIDSDAGKNPPQVATNPLTSSMSLKILQINGTDGRLGCFLDNDHVIVIRSRDNEHYLVKMDAHTHNSRGFYNGPKGPILAVNISANRSRLIAGGEDRTALVWDATSNVPVATFKGHDADVRAVALAADGSLAASADAGGKVCLWNVADAAERKRWSVEKPVLSLAFSADGNVLAAGDADGNLHAFSLDGKTAPPIVATKGDGVRSLQPFPADTNFLLGALGPRGAARLKLAPAKQQRIFLLAPEVTEVYALSLSADGRLALLVNRAENTLYLVDCKTGKVVGRQQEKSWMIDNVSLSPDARLLVANVPKNKLIAFWKIVPDETKPIKSIDPPEKLPVAGMPAIDLKEWEPKAVRITELGKEALLEQGAGEGDPMVATKKPYQLPVTFRAVVQTDSTNVRMYFGRGQVILNWESKKTELRIHDAKTGRAIGFPGKGYISENQYHDVKWQLRKDGMTLIVDGKPRLVHRADYSSLSPAPIGIGPANGSKIKVQKLEVIQ